MEEESSEDDIELSQLQADAENESSDLENKAPKEPSIPKMILGVAAMGLVVASATVPNAVALFGIKDLNDVASPITVYDARNVTELRSYYRNFTERYDCTYESYTRSEIAEIEFYKGECFEHVCLVETCQGAREYSKYMRMIRIGVGLSYFTGTVLSLATAFACYISCGP